MEKVVKIVIRDNKHINISKKTYAMLCMDPKEINRTLFSSYHAELPDFMVIQTTKGNIIREI